MEEKRTKIKAMVDALMPKAYIRPVDAIALQAFLTAPDDKLDSVIATLESLTKKVTEIEATYDEKEKVMLADYMEKVSAMQKEAERLDLVIQEDNSVMEDLEKEGKLLGQLDTNV